MQNKDLGTRVRLSSSVLPMGECRGAKPKATSYQLMAHGLGLGDQRGLVAVLPGLRYDTCGIFS